jgi:hypothetical protein
MGKLIGLISGETASVVAISIGAMVGGLANWALLIVGISYLLK